MGDVDLTPKSDQKVFEGEGGAYSIWSPSEFPLLAQAKVGAGKLVLQPRGFALPHFADSSKLGYVLQGDDGLVGMVFPNTSEEVVIKLKKGDVIPVPLGAVSWWFNNEDSDSDLVVLFLGETSKAHIPGQFTYFFLAGTLSSLGGFSTELLSKAYNITKDEADKVTKSQTGTLIIKLEQGKCLPKPNPHNITHKLVHNISDDFKPITTLTEKEFPFLKEAGLSASLIKLEDNAVCSPILYTTDSTVQVIYVVQGSGQVQIVGLNGKRVLDTQVTAGHLLVVPRFFMVSTVAGKKGLECFSIITSSQPVLEDLAGKTSVLGALSPEVLQVALNITPELEDLLKSKIGKS